MDKQIVSTESKKDTALTNKRQIKRGVISKAIYMVTEPLAESEPLKSALRLAAVGVLQNTSIQAISTLKDLLMLSSEVGIISSVNIQILLEAIEHIQKEETIKDVSLADIRSVFEKESEEHPLLNTEKDMEKNVSDVHHIDDEKLTSSHNIKDTHEVKIQQNIKDEIESKESTPYFKKDISTQNTSSYTSVVRSSAASLREDIQRQIQQKNTSFAPTTATTLDIGTRRKKILEVVRSKGQVTIHEFIQSIQGCSSKTIQRELTSLVLSGTLKKTGERRWSKYSLR